ncbi:MAG TPA: GAF domain-containing sensor histidine kinase [Usitatibacter sp.]|nr:GAF domain-containing sensor histidine kinase [Usitatibacter sp.]
MDDAAPEHDPRLRQLLEELEAARFLAKASATLAQVGDYENTLERIASLAVPSFADWFGVHVREPSGTIQRIAVKHRDPRMEAAVVELYRRYPPNEGKPYGAPAVIATGQPMWLPDFNKAIPAVARDATHAQLLEALGLRSFICVPMRVREKVLGALTFATAESGRLYSELQLRAAEDLATRAGIAIENSQLLETLQESDRRKDEFLAMLAHELRNPLAPVRNAIDLLKSKPSLRPEAQWITDVLDRQVRQMSRLVDDLLEVSRFTSGKIELRKEPMILGEAIMSAVEAARPAIDQARHFLEVQIPAEPIELEADAVRISQVVANLLNNAARYSAPGARITLAVSLEPDTVVIVVRDTGDGIAAENLEQIFELFVQGESRRDRKHGGLGLGLTLVRRLVEQHGGTVRASSEGPGKGSEFVVRLPKSLPRQHSAGTDAAAE